MALWEQHSLVGNILKSNNPYEILGVSRYGSKKEIDKCYKRTMSKVHPDKNTHPLATKAAQKVNLSRDLLLRGGSDEEVKLEDDVAEVFTVLREETTKMIKNLKWLLIFFSFLAFLWLVHLLNLVFANEWSLKRSSVHKVQRKTLFYRIRYYTLSESSESPSEHQVLVEYMNSMYDCCKRHLKEDPWYGMLVYFPSDDLCTEGKLSLIYAIVFLLICKMLYSYLIKRSYRNVKQNV